MTDVLISSLQKNGKDKNMENNPMDLTHKDENTESTEERTIMMDSIKALHTGEVRNEEPSYDGGYESVPDS